MIHDYPIPWSNSIKYLGITLNRNLTILPHTQDKACKITRRINAMKVVTSKPKGATANVLSKILKGAILPILDYGAPAFILTDQAAR